MHPWAVTYNVIGFSFISSACETTKKSTQLKKAQTNNDSRSQKLQRHHIKGGKP